MTKSIFKAINVLRTRETAVALSQASETGRGALSCSERTVKSGSNSELGYNRVNTIYIMRQSWDDWELATPVFGTGCRGGLHEILLGASIKYVSLEVEGVRESVTVCDRGGGQEHVTSRL